MRNFFKYLLHGMFYLLLIPCLPLLCIGGAIVWCVWFVLFIAAVLAEGAFGIEMPRWLKDLSNGILDD